ncbi:MAG: hypothetical protein A3J29_00535 [Acidobacteria bacterium RIFCSPLOWO2_12_FULL_67_14b]|nr:MAG: hypothetical protein A3J29_00535 [Acidobacteria bacterium RIFCSPLOWO2_12_FULL_67_14b]
MHMTFKICAAIFPSGAADTFLRPQRGIEPRRTAGIKSGRMTHGLEPDYVFRRDVLIVLDEIAFVIRFPVLPNLGANITQPPAAHQARVP